MERRIAKQVRTYHADMKDSMKAWFMENDPSVIDNTQWIFEVKDYIRFRLTGEAYAEITDYSGSSMMNIVDVAI